MNIQSVNITYNGTSSFVFGAPIQRITLLDSTNINFLRQVLVSQDGLQIIRGDVAVGIPMEQLFAVATTYSASMSWKPAITTQPVSQSVTAPTGAFFNVTASSETDITYIWQDAISGSSTFHNMTDSVPFSGTSTDALAVSNPSGLDQYQFRCVLTNVSGQTTSSAVYLNVS